VKNGIATGRGALVEARATLPRRYCAQARRFYGPQAAHTKHALAAAAAIRFALLLRAQICGCRDHWHQNHRHHTPGWADAAGDLRYCVCAALR